MTKKLKANWSYDFESYDIGDLAQVELSKAIADEIDNEILETIRVGLLSPEEREAEEIIRRLKGIRTPSFNTIGNIKIPIIKNMKPFTMLDKFPTMTTQKDSK